MALEVGLKCGVDAGGPAGNGDGYEDHEEAGERVLVLVGLGLLVTDGCHQQRVHRALKPCACQQQDVA